MARGMEIIVEPGKTEVRGMTKTSENLIVIITMNGRAYQRCRKGNIYNMQSARMTRVKVNL